MPKYSLYFRPSLQQYHYLLFTKGTYQKITFKVQLCCQTLSLYISRIKFYHLLHFKNGPGICRSCFGQVRAQFWQVFQEAEGRKNELDSEMQDTLTSNLVYICGCRRIWLTVQPNTWVSCEVISLTQKVLPGWLDLPRLFPRPQKSSQTLPREDYILRTILEPDQPILESFNVIYKTTQDFRPVLKISNLIYV